MKKKENLKQEETAKKLKKNKNKRNQELAVVTYIFIGLFFCMMGYFVYFNVALSDSVINSSYNPRQEILAERIVRGKILSNDGEVLAETSTDEDGKESRVYPFDNLFAHVVGYATKGKAGIELLGNINMLRSNAPITEQLSKEINEEKNIGNNLVTTLDVKLQQAAYKALGVYDGAIVVMEPSTGKILAMVSKPDFDPNKIDSIWDSLVKEEKNKEDAILVNRATQGLYPPGSTFKIVTTLAYLSENPDYSDYSYKCKGKITDEADDMTISCYHNIKHGTVDLKESFAQSCNSSFANIGMGLNKQSFMKIASSLLFNKELPVSLPYSKSNFPIKSDSDTKDLMQTAIGQGQTQITPIHMAMITSAIANKGVLMKPYLIDSIQTYTGDTVKTYSPSKYDTLMSEQDAATLTDFMTEVVNSGTASGLKDLEYQAAGKTGSAQFSSEKTESHAWFTGFAPAENPEIVVTIVVEGAGSGGEYAVPMAREIFQAYMSEKQ